MAGKQVTELDALPSFTDTSLLPVHNGAGLKKGTLTQLANYLGTKFSNPNLLINPDFKVNQRGASSYEQQGYSVDRWKIWNVTVTPSTSGGITIKNDKYTDTGTFIQILENATEGDSTLSCYVTSVTGTVTMFADDNTQVVLKQGLNVVHTSNSTKNFSIFLNKGTGITLKWAKLEQGKVATSFIAPNPADELIKCERFFVYTPEIFFIPYAGSRTSFGGSGQYYQNISGLFPVKMRANPTITHRIVRDSSNSTIPEKVSSVGADNYGISTITMEKTLSYYTLRMIDVKVDAEIY